MSRLLGVFLASVCAFATLAVSRPAAAQVYYSGPVTSYYAPTVAAPVVANYPAATTAYYAPTTTYYAPAAPVTSYYAPTTAYYAPATTAYYAPTTAYYAPTTAYYAPTTAYYAPTPYAAGYVGAPVYVRTSYYVPFQPVRNFFRAF